MKKPLTIRVIAGITTVLVASVVDFSVVGEKPTNESFNIMISDIYNSA